MKLGSSDSKKLLLNAHAIANILLHAEGLREAARIEAERRYEQVRLNLTEDTLANISIEQIKMIIDGRLRLEAIHAAGYSSVLDITKAPSQELARIQGVGRSSIAKIKAAAEQLADAIKTNLLIRIDVKKRTSSQRHLLEAVRRQEYVDQWIKEGALHFLTSTRADIENLLFEIEAVNKGPISRFFISLFRGNKKLDRAEAALDQLSKTLSSSTLEKQLLRYQQVSSHQFAIPIWEDFLSRPADFFSYLVRLGVQDADEHSASGHLPAHIVSTVKQQPLDESLLTVRLRGYQSFGAKYALVQKRILLGDEMGLGKTIQGLAILAHTAKADKSGLLVICPSAVVVNWIREIESKSKLNAVLIQGSKQNRLDELTRWHKIGGVGVMSFDAARSFHKEGQFDQIKLKVLIVDEAHYAKNPDAARSKAVKFLSQRSELVLFMSGTPLENRLSEFYSLLRYLQPKLVDACTDLTELSNMLNPGTFKERVAPVYLRRNQKDVLSELPDKIESTEWLQPGNEDLAAYDKAVIAGDFMAMRRAISIGGGAHSTKLNRLKEIVKEASQDGQKVLIFSYFLEVISLISSSLDHVFGPITGAVPAQQRQEIVDSYSREQGHAVLVSQIQAGGTGLNIQSASIVIIVEPQLKPSLETQAISRAHRMGQRRPVQVFRLLGIDTVDERIMDILSTKSLLFDAYARDSSIKDASADSTNSFETSLANQIIMQEQRRLAERVQRSQIQHQNSYETPTAPEA